VAAWQSACNREVAASNLGQGYFVPRSTQPSVPRGSVNEYQLRLGRQRQVWLIPLADETQGVQVKLWYPLTMSAIPEYLRDVCTGAIQIDITFIFTKALEKHDDPKKKIRMSATQNWNEIKCHNHALNHRPWITNNKDTKTHKHIALTAILTGKSGLAACPPPRNKGFWCEFLRQSAETRWDSSFWHPLLLMKGKRRHYSLWRQCPDWVNGWVWFSVHINTL